jgi:UDP-N-acetyl-2-amino-2-deoxyglucuronate dehydrogenase
MSSHVTFALIGASSVALSHGRALQRCPDVELVTVFSRDKERAKTLADALGTASTAPYEQIINDPTIDAIDIVTEPERHVELAMAAFQHGKHVLIEKPIDEDIHAAAELVLATKGTSLSLSVVAPKRFDRSIVEMKQRFEAGEIGSPIIVEIDMMLRRDIDYYLNGSGWRKRYGNVLLNQAIHWLDVLIWMFGFPLEVRATTIKHKPEIECYDTAILWAKHPGGVISTLNASTSCDRAYPETFRIYGDGGMLDYSLIQNAGKLQESRYRSMLNKLRRRLSDSKDSHQKTPLDLQITDFTQSIIKGIPTRVSLQDGYDALRLVRLCESASLSPVA